ncbi:hypothetical protein BDM02DRAFT_3105347 [Thelephora ganbajun]|uniref:Uncharacterized protein n=1 Tax=Thelephora ganbajun TaxID=370292 RepID=A0ACB6YZ19_THEGA|nr:hypothetical protein BDM02DRAFT_3105347 [Thelephora ganbajun]
MGRAVVSGATPDGTIQKTGRKNSIPLLVMEYKRAVGEGGCDPLTQASYSAWKYWQDKRLEGVRDKCCCPTFIVAGGGPYLAILGAIITDKYIVQRLTGLEWLGMGRVFEDNHLYRIAQVFDSLREALRELDEFHDDLDKQDLKLVDGKPHPRFYPYCTTFTDYTSKATKEFEYLRPLTLSNKSPFLVRFKSSGKMAVVKFVARYGAEAHQILAEAGMAPRLLFCGSIDGRDDVRNTSGESTKDVFGLRLGPPRMVVMEYIDGTHGEVLEAGDRPKDTHAQIKAMVDKLHGSDYVFGDLRPPNIVFSGGKPYLVDFDWAGKYGETFYPTELGEGITEHCEGKDLEIIEKDHDLALLDHYFLQT